ncbi:MAG: DUF2178 domain-containing protein [Hyphomonadaceae bacterium]|nr:DUF2178 domain-containing protein [Hyphomonadaceae bacterium]
MVAREQFAWVWLLTMLVTYPVYFAAVALAGETAFGTQILMFAVTAIVQVVVIGVASAVIGLRHKNNLSGDERDRAIAHRASALAYNILMAGIVLVGCAMPFGHVEWELFHAAVFVIALAEIVRHALIVAMYRGGLRRPQPERGWHG